MAKKLISEEMIPEQGGEIVRIDGKDYLYLDMTHLGKDVIESKLPDIAEFIRVYQRIDPVTQMVPTQPTAHYAMGGIPTDVDGRVVVDEQNTPLPGFYAAGECACVSVHGANRLGTNSLVDIIVFGRRGGRHMAQYAAENDLPPLPPDPEGQAKDALARLRGPEGEVASDLRRILREEMMVKASIIRTECDLVAMQKTLADLQERYGRVRVQDTGRSFNSDLVEAVELGFLIDVSQAIVHCALARTESRGAHYREDYPKRDDKNWLKHTLVYREDGELRLTYKPVTITRFQPTARTY